MSNDPERILIDKTSFVIFMQIDVGTSNLKNLNYFIFDLNNGSLVGKSSNTVLFPVQIETKAPYWSAA